MNTFSELLALHSIKCDAEQIDQFNAYFDILVEWNKKMNLTAITERDEVIIKHFYDSITPAFHYSFNDQKIIDIGAGAGFPSIPLKICFPKLKITLLDSLNKRINFLKHVANELNLKELEFIHGRAEEIAKDKDHREQYDIAISRAVARLNVLAEISLPFIKTNGTMIALKGTKANEELAEAERAFKLLGGGLVSEHIFDLPDNMGERTIILIDKLKKTPSKYPRKAGTPNREPII